MIYRLLGQFLETLLFKWAKKVPNCKGCRRRMEKGEHPRLFLLPLFHDHTYTPSAEFYVKNCRLIRRTEEIPVGQRACRMWICVCPQCGQRKVIVEDFLRVRDEEVLEKYVVLEENELAPLLYREV